MKSAMLSGGRSIALLRGVVGLAVVIFGSAVAKPDEDRSVFVYSLPKRGVDVRTAAGEDRMLLNQGRHVGPRLSPDSARVLYASRDSRGIGIWVAPVEDALDGRCPGDKVTDGDQPAWLPTGDGIVFRRAGRIVERGLASGDEQDVTPAGAPALAFPTCFPNGDILCTDAGMAHVYRIDRARGALTRLAEAELRSPPRAAPDGSRVAYEDGGRLYVLELASGKRRPLAFGPGVQAHPVWSADGRGVCYLQAPSPYEREWDLCCIDLDSPLQVRRLRRRVDGVFDWNGLPTEWPSPEEVRGGPVSIQVGRQVLPAERIPAAELQDTVTLDNGVLSLSATPRGKLTLTAQSPGNVTKVALKVVAASGRDPRLLSMTLNDATGGAALHLRYRDKGTEALAVFRLLPSTPAVSVDAFPAGWRLDVRADFHSVVATDRFAGDLIVMPGGIRRRSRCVLPDSPVVMGCVRKPQALVVIASSTGRQICHAAREGFRARLTSLRVEPMAAPLAVGLLDESAGWHEAAVAADDDHANGVEWDDPFSAFWRVSALGPRDAWSWFWDRAFLQPHGDGLVPLDESWPGGGSALIYPWRRDAHTPTETFAVMDVVWSALGVQGAEKALDLPGVLHYRSAERWAPFPNITTRATGWRPHTAHQEHTAFGVLEVMQGVFVRPTPGTHAFVSHLGGDACAMLRGLDRRRGEYEQALHGLVAYCGGRDDILSSEAARIATAALEAASATPCTDVARADEALDALAAVFDPKINATGPGGLVAETKEYTQFSRVCRTLQSERLTALAGLRAAAQEIRWLAARAIVADAASKEAGEALRTRTQAALRNRYYLEDDWRGETPLAKGPYECDWTWAP